MSVIEMFTSAGCSSCPPADEVLVGLAERRRKGESVFGLGLHVDYWDRLGWPDPYGSARATSRQQEYVRTLRGRGLYTPQAVIDGSAEALGSQQRSISRLIGRTSSSGHELPVRATVDNGLVTVSVEAPSAANNLIVAALVQDYATSVVTGDENKGRTLHHANVVRDLASAPIGSTILLRLKGLGAGWSVVAFLQNTLSLAIGAAGDRRITAGNSL